MSPAHRNYPWLVHAARRGRAAVQLRMTLAERGMPSIRSWWLPVPRVQAALTPAGDPTDPVSASQKRR